MTVNMERGITTAVTVRDSRIEFKRGPKSYPAIYMSLWPLYSYTVYRFPSGGILRFRTVSSR
jgi:hypothetical protein